MVGINWYWLEIRAGEESEGDLELCGVPSAPLLQHFLSESLHSKWKAHQSPPRAHFHQGLHQPLTMVEHLLDHLAPSAVLGPPLLAECLLAVLLNVHWVIPKTISSRLYQILIMVKCEITWARFLFLFCRHHICRDRWDRRSRKISVNCVKFWANNGNYEQKFHKLTHTAFCVQNICNKWSKLCIFSQSV